jgi:hypothetical protein
MYVSVKTNLGKSGKPNLAKAGNTGNNNRLYMLGKSILKTLVLRWHDVV